MLGPVEIVAEVPSTNAVLIDRARGGAPAGAVLVADHQSAGRGRLDRRWESLPGTSLLVSVLLRPQLDVAAVHLVVSAAGLAAVEACRAIGVPASLKWPNDVVVEERGEDRKLAGLLAESVVEGGVVTAVVVGMGLNLADGPHLPGTGTCVERVRGAAVGRDPLLDAWLEAFDARLEPLDPERLRAEYRARCATLGREVHIDTPGRSVAGTAVDIDPHGRLVVDVDGAREVFAVGDVIHAGMFRPRAHG
jgi:BirA family biotin operon repressor/biotin-[acetyl-CoA-carboxylase] ligase